MKSNSKLSDLEFVQACADVAKMFLDVYNLHIKNDDNPIVRFQAAAIYKEPKNEQHPCQTTACHGGWAAVSLRKPETNLETLTFLDGANLLAKKLGFVDSIDLQYWALHNSDIWGNGYAFQMFSFKGYLAFGFTDENKDACDLLFIANHWGLVARRAYLKYLTTHI